MSRKVKKTGLVGDLWPHIRLMKLTGMWILEFYEDNSFPLRFLRFAYCMVSSTVLLVQYVAILAFLFLDCFTGDQMASGTVTFLFFTHSIVKHIYFGVLYNRFSRLFKWWDQNNSHPLFTESNNRQRATALKRMRKLLTMLVLGTLVSIMTWTLSSFLGSQTREMPEVGTNHTILVRFPHLLFGAHGFYQFSEGWPYIIAFLLQFWFLTIGLLQANLLDTLFCCYVIFACEQLKHLKEVMRPIMELSGALDPNLPNPQSVFQATAANLDRPIIYESEEVRSASFVNEVMPQNGMSHQNGTASRLTKRQEIFVRSAIKYWVERHKHVVRYVNFIGKAYGGALLLHMLTSTVTLTLLAYQATKIDSINMYAVSVCGYLFYTLAQVFVFCVHGNELIEESTSVMEAAYACHWYDGSDEAKTFIQIVCQQCQKSLTVSGAKFFTISLDLFASVLGAVVTYFMVLIQLK